MVPKPKKGRKGKSQNTPTNPPMENEGSSDHSAAVEQQSPPADQESTPPATGTTAESPIIIPSQERELIDNSTKASSQHQQDENASTSSNSPSNHDKDKNKDKEKNKEKDKENDKNKEKGKNKNKNKEKNKNSPEDQNPRHPLQIVRPPHSSNERPRNVQCPWCKGHFVNLQGHKCPSKDKQPAPSRNNAAVEIATPGTANSCPNWPFSFLSGMTYEDIFTSPLTISDVPRKNIGLFSSVVIQLTQCIIGNDKQKSEQAWKAFFLLPRLIFALPRGGKKVSRQVYNNLTLFRNGEWEALLARRIHYVGEPHPGGSREKRAESLARAGYMSGAARALCDGVRCNTADPAVYNELRKLHPAASQQCGKSQLAPADVVPEKEFLKVLSSLPPRRAPDATGWRGEYFKRLNMNGKESLFKLSHYILQNPKSLPADLLPYFFGARLIALPKPHGGIRPIAIGVILRKLISTTLANVISPQLPDFFTPYQFGVGVSGGVENVVQGLRLANALKEGSAVVEIDFTNAFNSVERPVISEHITHLFPQLKTWFELCYGQPSYLLVQNQKPIQSARGVQQGDPLGPFLFALALQPLLKEIAKNGNCCVMAYLDDVYICGKPDDVAFAIKELLRMAQQIGLSCNKNKCWATKVVTVDGVRLPLTQGPEVLGAPLDPNQKLSVADIPRDLMKNISEMDNLQIALHLLRYVHNGKFTQSFRLSSGQATQELAKGMMATTRKTLSRMLGHDNIPDSSWQQALLPMGPGLGFSNLEISAPYMAYASILESTSRLSSMGTGLFMEFINEEGWEKIRNSPVYTLRMAALEAVKNIKGFDMSSAKQQKFFASHVIEPKMEKDFLSSPSIPDSNKAIVSSTKSSPIAKQFLHAIPSNDDLSLSTREMKISLHLLLGIEIEMKKQCGCKSSDPSKPLTMYHALSCKKNAGLILRHDMVKDTLVDLCKSARLSCEVEPRQALAGDKKRPDFLIRLAYNGKDAAYDLTIHSPVRDNDSIKRTIRNEQSFLESAKAAKENKYLSQCAKDGILFYPIVLSSFGGILEESYSEVIEPIINKIKGDYFVPPNWAANDRKTYWLQRIAIALWKGNVRKMARFIKNDPIEMF